VAAKGHVSYTREGVPTRMIGIFQDITKNKATEAALVRTEKLAAAGRLAASIAHEINNPLFAVTNLLFIIQGDATLSGAGREYLSLAQQELARAAHIAQQALGFYKETAEPVKVNIAEVVDEVLLLYARNMPANIKLETEYGQGCEAYAVRGEIRQVLGNLIANAIQALGGGGTLSIKAQQQAQEGERGIAIRVIDDGPGIAPEHRDRIFEPFFTTKKDVGTGLGLWLAKQIVQKHGGSIEVQSSTDRQQHGTTFSILLPEGARKAKHAAA
jgi:signal transduction histidine kinase